MCITSSQEALGAKRWLSYEKSVSSIRKVFGPFIVSLEREGSERKCAKARGLVARLQKWQTVYILELLSVFMPTMFQVNSRQFVMCEVVASCKYHYKEEATLNCISSLAMRSDLIWLWYFVGVQYNQALVWDADAFVGATHTTLHLFGKRTI